MTRIEGDKIPEGLKNLIERDLRRLDFVDWDRFIVNNSIQMVTVYGWIDRKEKYKEFLVLQYTPGSEEDTWVVTYTTSSPKQGVDISKALTISGKNKKRCQRVEDLFDIKNSIRLVKNV